MLRRLTTARLAFQHSPEREQRLVLFAGQKNDQHGGQERDQEISGTVGIQQERNPVDVVREHTWLETNDAMPEEILKRLQPDVAFDMFTKTGALSRKLEDTARDMNVTIDTATLTEKASVMERLLTMASEDDLIRAAQAIATNLEHYEKLLDSPQKHLKRIERLGADPVVLNKIASGITSFADADKGSGKLDKALKAELINAENVTRILKLKDKYTANERENILEILRDVDRANRIWNAYGQIPGKVETDPEQRRRVREQFIDGLHTNLVSVVEYAESKIRNRIKKLEKQVDDIAIHYDGETLDRFGITADGVGDVLQDTSDTLRGARSKMVSHAIGTRIDAQYLNTLNGEVEKIDHLEQHLSSQNSDLPLLLLEQKNHEEAMEEWAREKSAELSSINVEKMEAKSPKAASRLRELQEFFKPYENGNKPTNDERIAIRQTTRSEQVLQTKLIEMLRNNPAAFEQAEIEDPAQDQIPQIVARVRAQMHTLMPDLLSKIDHPVCDTLNLRSALLERQTEINMHLKATECNISINADGHLIYEVDNDKEKQERINLMRAKSARRAASELEHLRRCNDWLAMIRRRDSDLIVHVDDPAKYQSIARTNSYGCYSYEDGHIYLDTTKIKANPNMSEQRVIEHERGHALIDAFRRHRVFPMLLTNLHRQLHTQQTTDGRSFQQLLVAQAPQWEIAVINPQRPTHSDIWKLMDELANRYAEWKTDGKPAVGQDLASLYDLFARKDEWPDWQDTPLSLKGVASRSANDLPGDDGGGDNTDSQQSAENAEQPEKDYAETLLDRTEKYIQDIDAFLQAYPHLKSEAEELYNYSKIEKTIQAKRKKFRSGAYERDADFIPTLKKFNGVLKTFADDIERFQREQSNLSHVEKTGTRNLWQIIFRDVEWMSIYDAMTMFKDAGEDIARMWKRRGEGVRSRVGKAISGMIPEDIIYLGRLKHEFERRDRESEEAEVGVWEKGWEKIDAHELQHDFMPRVKSADQLKAIIKLLVHHGRLEWDDERGLWSKLEEFSGYRMPREACHLDTRLRNTWLQKMIGEIWRDKDLYENWKTENDGNIKSGTDKFTNYADDISASGMHATELRRLLMAHDRIKHGSKEEANPHLYEKILFHAMFNGKSSMEAKFFYLIKGVESGILSIDRLRAFSGEGFGILNQFPFIDFFSSGQNNTMHEIKRIAAKVTESGTGADPFKPGARMTTFLYTTVAFDKNVKDRVQKALKRGENIDHEDIPMAITQMGFNEVSQFINFTSGSQAKSSAPALKNGYVGYASFLKYFAIKSKIGHPPLTNRDISKLVDTLGAYMQWDNTITRYSLGAATDQKPSLTWSQINNEAPVSGPRMTSAYRDPMNKFTLDLSKALGITQVNGIDIEDFVGVERNNQTADALFNKYCTVPPGAPEGQKKRLENKADIFESIQRGPENFIEQLRDSITRNPSILKNLLEEAEQSFIPESVEFTEENVRKIWNNNGHSTSPSPGTRGHAGHGATHRTALAV